MPQRVGPWVSQQLVSQGQGKQALSGNAKVAVGGAAEAGLSQKFSEKPIPLSGSGDLLSEDFLTPR